MSSFSKIALLGKGLLGTTVLEQLVNNGFTVTVLSRDPAGLKGLPSGVATAQVDYSSHDSIRYIPADWSSLTTNPKARTLPINYPLIQVQEYLKKKADEGVLEHTIFSVGAFLDYVLDFPFILDLRTHSIQIYDDGEHPFSSTSVSSVGKAVAGALKAPEETKNRNPFIHETILTQAKVLALAKRYSLSGVEWTETRLDSQEELDRAIKNLEKDPADFNLIFPLLRAALLGGKYRAAYPKVDNEIVGVSLLTDEELEQKFAAKFQDA
ncbi:hypothetical protein LCI18_009645 [Fusarium solani-melongenae]|uniref:Uncharacterized protein n=1 Tax=Fusarium solani subsp. cucurbitae TaxID=2747967 RepID=A0ACD3ZC70_FUSSC|nr:hypothetical protein LCI18_009645 [Fusarium solani-melongenae]